MGTLDVFGFLAGGLTVATFTQTSVVRIRITGIAVNLSFLTYACMGHFLPILVLHGLLLPINTSRLLQLLSASRRQGVLPTRAVDRLSGTAAPLLVKTALADPSVS